MPSPNATTQPERSSGKSVRLHYLDWLRVLAILGVFLFHAVHPFDAFDWEIKNAEQSLVATLFIVVLAPWGMPFFYLIAGTGSWFALRRRTGRQYTIERVNRLLIPFIIGSILLPPIQAYVEFIHKGLYEGSFLAFLPIFFDERVGPDRHELFSAPLSTYLELLQPKVFGNWGYHLWFLGFLFCFSCIALPFFFWLKRDTGGRFITWLGRMSEKRGGILLFIFPLLLIQLTLRPVYPDLRDWADFIYYLVFFACGYILFADERFKQAIQRDWRLALTIGIISTLSFVVTFGYAFAADVVDEIISPTNPLFYSGWGAYAVSNWCMVIFILYAGMRFLDFRNKWLAYGQEAVMPFYLLHQPVTVVSLNYSQVSSNSGLVRSA